MCCFPGELTGTHLTEESVEVTIGQRQTTDDMCICCIEFTENVSEVGRRDAVLWTVKGVYQRQNVAVEGKNKAPR